MLPADTSADVVVVGAGIVGLAHAVRAVEAGLRVHVVERDERAVGASVRNFGHVGIAGQGGRAYEYVAAGRATWVRLGAAAGFGVSEAGAVVVARSPEEMAVLEEFAADRDGLAELLHRRRLGELVPLGEGVLGGARLLPDLRVDQRAAVGALAGWLDRSGRASVSWGTTFWGLEADGARTSHGPIRAPAVVVCVGHDVDRVFPDVADEAGLRRCRLHMLEVDNPTGAVVAPAVLSGHALVRYSGFARCPSRPALAERLEVTRPELVEAGMNLMFTQRPDGRLVIGDTHDHARTHDPFVPEARDELVLTEAASLLGVERLTVRARWRGTYATAEGGEFLVAGPAAGSRVVSVTAGIGMSTAFGLAEAVLADLLG